MSYSTKSESGPPPLLRRRDFLTLGSAGLLMPLFGSLAWAEPLAAAAAAAPQPMSVGYIDGSETFRNLKWLPRKVRRPLAAGEEKSTEAPLVIVPAASLFQADTSLPGRPLRIHVHGLYPPVALEYKRHREVPPAIDLEAVFPSNDPASPAPLRTYLWGLRQKYGWDPSPPMSFRFPLDWQVLPQFILRVRGTDGTQQVLRTRFTLDNEPDRPKLRRGVYVLGLDPTSWKWAARLTDFARVAPAEMFSVLVSIEPEAVPAT
jgi:hypothetical protein